MSVAVLEGQVVCVCGWVGEADENGNPKPHISKRCEHGDSMCQENRPA